jgi:hypothetical protein
MKQFKVLLCVAPICEVYFITVEAPKAMGHSEYLSFATQLKKRKTLLMSSIDILHLLYAGACIIVTTTFVSSIGNLNVLLAGIPHRKLTLGDSSHVSIGKGS